MFTPSLAAPAGGWITVFRPVVIIQVPGVPSWKPAVDPAVAADSDCQIQPGGSVAAVNDGLGDGDGLGLELGDPLGEVEGDGVPEWDGLPEGVGVPVP